jgi:hypothetical protein
VVGDELEEPSCDVADVEAQRFDQLEHHLERDAETDQLGAGVDQGG